MTDLHTLSDAATQGEWGCYGDTIYGPSDEHDISYLVCESCNPPNSAFIAALANAYRAGTLVDVSDLASLVKPLVWEDMDDYWRARTPFGDYEAGWDDGAWAVCDGPLMWEWVSDEDHRGMSVYQARAAAEAHWIAQVLAAFDLPAKEDAP